MRFPILIAGTVAAVLATGALARGDPPASSGTTMPNANQTPENPADGTMPNANGTLPSSGTINPNGTTNGTSPAPIVAPPVPDCVPSATNACAPNPNCQPPQVGTPATPPAAGNPCPPPVLPNGR